MEEQYACSSDQTNPAVPQRFSFNDQPVLRSITKSTNSISPTASTISPGTRNQRRNCMVGVCMNSAERAYQ